ncbi:MAG: hypothetical protein HYV13_02495 [Candidatus Doudnabacteria bacterium]|nr:hypothetical protein [Candidatus Doudnabacteria bacterium]
MKIILTVLAMAGVITIAVVAPALPAALGAIFGPAKQYSNKQLKRSLANLKKNGLISMSYEGKNVVIKLTKDGKEKLLKYQLENMRIKPQKHWDRKFRAVIFDIPKEYKQASNLFAQKLKELDFVMLQKSVWVCPYPCEDEIDFLKEIYHVRPFVRLATIEKLDIQHDLIKKFNLKA